MWLRGVSYRQHGINFRSHLLTSDQTTFPELWRMETRFGDYARIDERTPAYRSLLPIPIRSPKTSGSVDLGTLGTFRDGRYQNCERIRFRAEGIETLRTNFPWVDSVDIRMFLMGFDVGEKYSTAVENRRIDDSPEAPHVQD